MYLTETKRSNVFIWIMKDNEYPISVKRFDVSIGWKTMNIQCLIKQIIKQSIKRV